MLKKLDEVLIETSKQLGIDSKLEDSKILLSWSEVVGESIAKNTKPTHYKSGILYVSTKSPVWAHHLTINKQNILKKLNELTDKVIKEIRFSATGPVSE